MSDEHAIETYEFGGKTIRIFQDSYPASPREWSCLGVIMCMHRKYSLGDEHTLKAECFDGWDEIEAHLIAEGGALHILPIYLFDHSGIALSTTAFGCPWDSGQVGFIYATEATMKECGTPPELVEGVLRDEVETYSKFLSGEVYGYTVVSKEECAACNHVSEDVEDSWGYYSVEEAKEAAQNLFR